MENRKQRIARELRELEGKNIAHYQVLLESWIQTKMERDKTIVTLSAAAIGLLLTLLTTVGVKSLIEMVLFVISAFGFLVAIWSSLRIYELNSEHIEDAMRGHVESSPILEKYDRVSKVAFVCGAIFAFLIGVVAAKEQLAKTGEANMSSKQNKGFVGDSVNGLGNISPNVTKRSINGLGGVSPQQVSRPQQTSQPSSSQGSGNSKGSK